MSVRVIDHLQIGSMTGYIFVNLLLFGVGKGKAGVSTVRGVSTFGEDLCPRCLCDT